MDPIQKFARRLKGVERLAMKAATQPQLAYSSIEDGAIQSVVDGSLKAIIGQQYDGTQAITVVNGPNPPIPSPATGTAVVEGARIRWDGTFADGSVAPMDFSRVEVHASADPDFTAEFAETLIGTFETPRGGEFFASLPSGANYVKLVTRSQTGAKSDPSTTLEITPQALADVVAVITDGDAPTESPDPNVAGGIGAIFVSWDPVDNQDPVSYEIHVSDTTGFTPDSTTLAGETRGGLFVVRTLPEDGTDLAYDVDYFIRIVAKDADGPAPASDEKSSSPRRADTPDIAVNAITADKILSGEITAEKLASVMALLSQLYVGENISILPEDSSPGANDNGIMIRLDNGGYIHLPADGSAAELIKVIARFTEVIVEDNMQILGANNRVGGALTLDSNIPPPDTAPTLASVQDPAPLSVTAGFVGLGDDGVKWQVGKQTNFTRSDTASTNPRFGTVEHDGSGTAVLSQYGIDKSTGAATLVRSVNIVTNTYMNAVSSVSVPASTLISFHGTALNSVFVLYCPAFSYTYRTVTSNDIPTTATASVAAKYMVVVVNNTTGAVTFQGPWSGSVSGYFYPAVFTDDTNIWMAASIKATGALGVYKTGMSMGTILSSFSTSVYTFRNMTGLYVGNADYGSLRYIFTLGGALPGAAGTAVWNGSSFSATESWTGPTSEAILGIVWDGSHFRTLTSGGKIRKASTVKTDTAARVGKYTWHNIASAIESTASPAASLVQNAREWLQVSSPVAIPTTGDAQSPDSLRFYIDGHRQTDLAAGVTTATYEVPTTGGVDAPATDGFAAISTYGLIQSEGLDLNGLPTIDLRGSGEGRVGPYHWDDSGELPAIQCYKTSAQSAPAGTSVGVVMNNTRWGTGGMVRAANGWVQVPRTGWYDVSGNITFASSTSSTQRICGVAYSDDPSVTLTVVSGTIITHTQTTFSGIQTAAKVYLTEGQYVGLWMNAGVSFALAVSQVYMNTLSVAYIGG